MYYVDKNGVRHEHIICIDNTAMFGFMPGFYYEDAMHELVGPFLTLEGVKEQLAAYNEFLKR